ncbi:MAG: hypothetical protein HOL98_15925 [Gammaproteobacteria bacterium]|jgi:hypothetical protein|nr:hypothetical protein [Gammaproteobacteria bacterium]MBT5204948.1 hypothetical protein [Gammaproteobacteria bacterium]MBT5601537.1 hypothetical protein [Gammaproteobacteria bacterium]MBT6247102.1 hypothetical protein [Gammaproteobacteria bacterium]
MAWLTELGDWTGAYAGLFADGYRDPGASDHVFLTSTIWASQHRWTLTAI